MAFVDWPLEQLKAYLPARDEPRDFDSFWAQTLVDTRRFPLAPKFEPVDVGLALVSTYDVTFNGFGGQPIKGWLTLPKDAPSSLPCVLEFVGYGGGRGHPHEWLLWATAGYAHFVMDTRGQGSTWTTGDTPDPEPDGSNPHYPGFMTRGIASPQTYYYRRVFTDAVRALETMRGHPAVDGKRVFLAGGSQGGGIALAVAGLVPDVAGVMPRVPFLCHYRVATQLIDTAPYNEIARYCKVHRDKIETVFDTLAYFDGVNFAARAKAPALFSVGLMDDVCPPRTVFAAYNHYAGPKQLRVWEYNAHDGGGTHHNVETMRFVQHIMGS